MAQTMRKIKVLIVDDAVVVRRIITNALSDDSTLDIVGVAANGKIALEKIPRLNPDIITLDIEMPVMDGLQTVTEIRKLYPRLPVIMFSTLTERGATASLDALALGANDYVTKPANVGSVGAAMQCLREELIPKIKALCGAVSPVRRIAAKPPANSQSKDLTQSQTLPAKPKPAVNIRSRRMPTARVDLVAIGISTGGPNALAELIPSLPADLPVPIVIVQHMPPLFTKLLAERLEEKSDIRVHEGTENTSLEPGHVYLAPGDYHMEISRADSTSMICLNQGPQENSCRPAVDVLFRSVANIYKENLLAVIMTGMGQDGLLGCEYVSQLGGQVIVQDEPSSVIWGMPGAVARAGLAEAILPLDLLGAGIVKRVQKHRSSGYFNVNHQSRGVSCP